jgi:hypothetical protein
MEVMTTSPRSSQVARLPTRNGSHTYGDKFTDAERMAVIEYLKTT